MRGGLHRHGSGRGRRGIAGRSSQVSERLPLVRRSGRECLVGDGAYTRIMTATMIDLRGLVPLEPGRSITSYVLISKTLRYPSDGLAKIVTYCK